VPPFSAMRDSGTHLEINAALASARCPRRQRARAAARGARQRWIPAILAPVAIFGALTAGGAGAAVDAHSAFPGRNGRIVVQVTAPGGTGPANLVLFHADKGAQIQLTRGDDHNANPAWSPDGARIAYNSNRSGVGEADFDLWIVAEDVSSSVQVTRGRAVDTDPSWSPDGRRLAYESDAGGSIDIWTVGVDGSNPVRLTSAPGEDADPAWSPDGAKIAFTSSRDGNREIYVMNADGSGQQRLTVNPDADRHPSWAPDGSRIAFDSDRSGNFEIYIVDANGSNVVKMTNHPAVDARPAWSPQGDWIVFQSERAARGARQIFRIATGGGAAFQERNVWFYRTWATSADWQPRGGDPCDLRGTIFNDRIDIYETSRGPETILRPRW
jgi:Tol biopolymer transport system component